MGLYKSIGCDGTSCPCVWLSDKHYYSMPAGTFPCFPLTLLLLPQLARETQWQQLEFFLLPLAISVHSSFSAIIFHGSMLACGLHQVYPIKLWISKGTFGCILKHGWIFKCKGPLSEQGTSGNLECCLSEQGASPSICSPSLQHILVAQREISVTENGLEAFRQALQSYTEITAGQSSCLQ